MLKIIIILLSITFLTSCTKMHFDFGWGIRPSSLAMDPPEGPPEYQQAWTDGCKSGYGGYANNSIKVFYGFHQDPYLAQDPTYYKMWKDAYSYCATYGLMTDDHGLGNSR